MSRRVIARALAIPFFAAAAAFYVYSHWIGGETFLSDVVTWLATALIATPGLVLWTAAKPPGEKAK